MQHFVFVWDFFIHDLVNNFNTQPKLSHLTYYTNAILCSRTETVTSHPKNVFNLNSSFMMRTQVERRLGFWTREKQRDLAQPQEQFFKKLIMCSHNRAIHGEGKKDFWCDKSTRK